MSILKELNNKKFNDIMEEIDKEISEISVQISGREIKATMIFSKKFNIKIIDNPRIKDSLEKYTVYNLSEHISKWYQSKYGTKLDIKNNIADIILIIKGIPYQVGLPSFYGAIRITFDSNMTKFENTIGRSPVIFNLAPYIDGLTPKMAESLSEAEIKKLLITYVSVYKAVLKYLQSKIKYYEEALSDFKSAVFKISNNESHAQAKWDLLQFIEKLLKGLLDNKQKKVEHIHKLDKLSEEVNLAYGIMINSNDISSISCKPGVRYGEIDVSEKDLLDAYNATLKIFIYTMENINFEIS